MNDLFISMEYNDRQFEGIPEFKEQLQQSYQFQLRTKWISSYAEGAEFWMTLFVNSELSKFLASAVAGGMAWDLIKVGSKNYIFTPFINALEELNTKNEQNWNGLKILKFKFQFDDCEIYVGGLNENFTSIMSNVFNEISKKKPKFERLVGLKVIKIELPVKIDKREWVEESDKYKVDTSNKNHSINAFLKLWKLTFETEFPVMIYDFKNDTLKDI